MKKQIYFIMLNLALVLVLITGCSVKKDFTLNLEKEFVQTNSPNKTYSYTGDISATTLSSDFDTYKGDIDAIEFTSAKYLVSYFSGTADQTISAHFKIGDTQGAQSVDFATISNVNLLSVAAKDQDLNLSSAGQSKLLDLIKNSPYGCRLYFDGSTNQVPITFTLKIKLQLKVTYKKNIL